MSKEIFKNNPELKEAFITVDGTPFYSRNAAENHARTLKSREITRITNPSISQVDALDMDDPQNVGIGLLQTGTDENGNPELKQVVAQLDENGSVDLAVQSVNDADTTQTGNVAPDPVVAEKLTPKQILQKDYFDKFGEVPADNFTKAELMQAFTSGEKLVAEISGDESKNTK